LPFKFNLHRYNMVVHKLIEMINTAIDEIPKNGGQPWGI
jgi:hypothetical protein